jgi:hypothetical protein
MRCNRSNRRSRTSAGGPQVGEQGKVHAGGPGSGFKVDDFVKKMIKSQAPNSKQIPNHNFQITNKIPIKDFSPCLDIGI